MMRIGRWMVLVGMVVIGGCVVTSKNASFGEAQGIEDISGVRNLSRDGDIWFAGQPTEEGLGNLKNAGISRIVNFRTDAEMVDAVGFDEIGVVGKLGMTYESIPFRGNTVDVEHADALAKALSRSTEPTLLHCGSSNRVGAVWAIYLNYHKNVASEEAIRLGRLAGMTSSAVEDRVRQHLK